MRREERNAKISELRREWCSPENDIALTKASPEETHGLAKPIDWHADANWPTLYREMPMPALNRRHDNLWRVTWDWEGTHGLVAERPEEGVCEAWLHWKEHGRTT